MTRRMTCSFVLAWCPGARGHDAASVCRAIGHPKCWWWQSRDRLSFRPLRVSRQTRELPYRRENVVIETRVGVLVSTNRALNDSEVSFTGEAVGGVVNAGEGYKWANISGTSNAVISVYLSDDLAKLIQNVGDYHTTGTTLKITGTYHIACPWSTRASLTCTHLPPRSQTTVAPVTHMVVPGRLEAALALCAVAALFLMLYLLARRYFQRKAQP